MVIKLAMKKRIIEKSAGQGLGTGLRDAVAGLVTGKSYAKSSSRQGKLPLLPPSGELNGTSWPLHLFDVPGHENPDAHQTIDLTGRWRPIIFGPYIELPPGTWEATLRFRIDVEGGSNYLGFDWGGLDASFVEFHTRVTVSGDYEITMANAWDKPISAEFRVFIAQPAFQGKFTFLECRVKQLA